ncbi:unnamed protein product [Paramecium pentaurelia]|uniref:J domain-containing protein n=1 Tax=Paramecium pentaurelia TaxID=43138 RepID=A0A8S1SFQ0_9CILI|nr:unnamed protein product [Paramecium pentaurelia]
MLFNKRIWKKLIYPIPRYYFFQPPLFDVNKDYYKILNCNQTDSEQKLKQEYYKLAKLYHPDINKGNEEKFKQITEAWDVLSDKHRKQQYDAARTYNTDFIKNTTNSYGYNQSNQQNYSKSNNNHQQFSKEQMEQMQKQAEEIMKMFQSGQFNQFSQAFKQATKNDPKFKNVHTFINLAEKAEQFFKERQKTQMENEIKKEQNFSNFANKEDKLKQSVNGITNGIKNIWNKIQKNK